MTSTGKTPEIVEGLRQLEVGMRTSAAEHRLACSHLQKLNSALGAPTAALSAASGATILANSAGPAKTAAGILALVVAATAALSSFFGFGKQADEHLTTANNLSNLATEADTFRRELLAGGIEDPSTNEEHWKRYREIEGKRDAVVIEAPNVTDRTKKSLKKKTNQEEEGPLAPMSS
jgi:hypothetical protein